MKNILLVAAVVIISTVPLIIVKNGDFTGVDDKALAVVKEHADGYKPWAVPVWEPPSSEIASLLFAVQAALGSGVVFFILGYLYGKSKGKNSE